MRKLEPIEEKRLALLTSKSVEVTLIEPTETGLKKSIMDATSPVRRFLRDANIHDYDCQKQGPEHKILVPSFLMSEGLIIPSLASLYRPVTKKGDPRIWFKGLPAYSSANDILALIIYQGQIYAINISQIPLEKVIEETKTGPIWDLVNEISHKANSIADELLEKLKVIARRGPIPSVTVENADTAIGRTLETHLGIKINSRKEPDYKGIELKSFRRKENGRENRKTLFAQVANWEVSKFKSSKEILEHFGYTRGEDFKLYCTISTQTRNSQGLQFKLDTEAEHLIENSDKKEIGDFAVWLMDDLRNRLLEKHNETFWIAADSRKDGTTEHFQFTKVLHTRKPIVSQFDILVEQGVITMDHLIKRNSAGRVSEKGPLFKIESNSLEMLFPPSETHCLL
jgi:hypothetical protein